MQLRSNCACRVVCRVRVVQGLWRRAGTRGRRCGTIDRRPRSPTWRFCASSSPSSTSGPAGTTNCRPLRLLTCDRSHTTVHRPRHHHEISCIAAARAWNKYFVSFVQRRHATLTGAGGGWRALVVVQALSGFFHRRTVRSFTADDATNLESGLHSSDLIRSPAAHAPHQHAQRIWCACVCVCVCACVCVVCHT